MIRDEEKTSGRARTPVVAVSANAMTHQVKEYLEAGMDGHVAKPIELTKLHGAMAKALESNAELEAQRAA
jgi:CheY-like chemotaxis protein